MPTNRDSRWWAVLAKALRSASLNPQKHCPPYTKDLLISRLPQTLDVPLGYRYIPLAIAIYPWLSLYTLGYRYIAEGRGQKAGEKRSILLAVIPI